MKLMIDQLLAPTHLSKNILSQMAQRYAHWPATQASKPISSCPRSMAMVEATVVEGGDILTAGMVTDVVFS